MKPETKDDVTFIAGGDRRCRQVGSLVNQPTPDTSLIHVSIGAAWMVLCTFAEAHAPLDAGATEAECSHAVCPRECPNWNGEEARLTPTRVELARHALGLDGRRRMSYRNRFVTGPGSRDYDEWVAMVAAGMAYRREGTSLPFGGQEP